MKVANGAVVGGLVDLAAANVGGRTLGSTDDFFAEADNLLREGRGEFIADKYTERGKWMDGWESRRKRVAGHDSCLIELGIPGEVRAFDIDTNHFIGNAPAFASVEGVKAPRGTAVTELEQLQFTELLPPLPLLPGSQNLFVATAAHAVSHLRLRIYPDGGVARFRVYGKVSPEWGEPELDEVARQHVSGSALDLVALKNGGACLACSDATFGGMNNLLLPGRAKNMGSGWETRRRRYAGFDWIVVQLGARGTPGVIEVDTNHFKGNYPDRCSIDFIDQPDANGYELTQSSAWQPLLPETKLQAHTRHFFKQELLTRAPATHLRLNIFPDGGVSRLRVWGERNG